MNKFFFSMRSNQQKFLISLLFSFVCLFVLGYLFREMYPTIIDFFSLSGPYDVDSASEIWIGLLVMILGTLTIVISIAAQSTPKLIDLYVGNPESLLFIWLVTLGTTHCLILQSGIVSSDAGVFFNVFVFLPLCVFLSIPYILYILNFTKTKNIIRLISKDSCNLIDLLSKYALSKHKGGQIYILDRLFTNFNNLDDLFEYVQFKEPKADIIGEIGGIVRHNISLKCNFSEYFFNARSVLLNDISFKTMADQVGDLEESMTFIEWKGYRLISSAYMKLLESDDFDLASMCAGEIYKCGKLAIDIGREEIVDLSVIQFNTLFRFCIKHASRSGEVRNIYNLIFYYSRFIVYLINREKFDNISRYSSYFNFYGTLLYRLSKNHSEFNFALDAMGLEFNKILIACCDKKVPSKLQIEILRCYLRLNKDDFLGDGKKDQEGVGYDVRIMPIQLALFYEERGESGMVSLILADIFENVVPLNKDDLIKRFRLVCGRIKSSDKSFWEDNDRGGVNIYYSQYSHNISSIEGRFVGMLS